MAQDRAPDWPSIRAVFECDGSASIRAIGRRFCVSHVAIHKRAKAEGWGRAPGNGGAKGGNLVVTPLPMPRASTVSADGGQPGDILSRAKREAETLLSELEETRRRMDEIEDTIEDETRHDTNGRRRAMMMKAVSLPSRTLTLKTLSQALNTITEIEGTKGKKEQRADKAKETAGGKFAASAPPRLMVDNTKA